LRCLEILGKLPPALTAIDTLLRVAMDDPDDKFREKCIEEIKRTGSHLALPRLTAELKNKSNARVNRAGECLRLLGDKNATIPLTDAMLTKHIEMVAPGGIAPVGMSLGSGDGAGSGQGGGLSSFGFGGKPKANKKTLENPSVRKALAALYPR